MRGYLRYTPPIGPAVDFQVTYNQREANQPSTFSYANIGKKWTFTWLSYITDNPGVPIANVELFVKGGGTEIHRNFDTLTSSFAPQRHSQTILVRTSISPIKYERRLSDGSIEFFEVSNGAGTFPRKVFLTKIADPVGHSITFTYDASLRMVAVTDAIGQITTLSYGLAGDSLKVTQVTDPFGRSAYLEYNGSDQLERITDVAGLASEFEYDSGDFIKTLTTPYGSTHFDGGEGQYLKRWIQATDPLGMRERVEFRYYTPLAIDTPMAPTGMMTNETMLEHEPSSIFWGKKEMSQVPFKFENGTVYQWLRSTNYYASSNIISTIKRPLESRVWFNYPGQYSSKQIGTDIIAKPSKVGRVLDDSSTQLSQYDYNALGNITKTIDPYGRTSHFVYDGSGVDLLSVRQKVGATTELLDTLTYNLSHQPLTQKDASGQVTGYAYDSLGNLHTVTNPMGQVASFEYDTVGYLMKIRGHIHGDTTKFTYDNVGRVRTVTNLDGYTTRRIYDNLDRVIKVEYPDSTNEEFVFNRLDVEKAKDRLGRWTKTIHNANRQPVTIQDPQGRTTNLDWCSCGNLQTLTDPRGKVTKWNWDVEGRLVSKVYDDGKVQEYSYENEGGRLKTATDSKGQISEFRYFKDGNQKQISYANAEHATPTVSFTYDMDYNRMASMTDGIGVTYYFYRPITVPSPMGAGRLYKIDGPWSNDTVTFKYDSLGRVLATVINGVSDSLVYDSLGRVVNNINALGNFTYKYVGASGRLDSVLNPNGQRVGYSYYGTAGDILLSEIKNLGRGNVQISKHSYTYDAESQIKTWIQQADSSNARIHDFSYDKANQLLGSVIKSASVGNPILKHFAYRYDKGGNRINTQEDDFVQSATYNGINQIVSSDAGGSIQVGGSLSEGGSLTVNGQPSAVAADNSFSGNFPAGLGADTLTLVATDYSSNTATMKYAVSTSGTSQSFKYDDNGNMSGDRYEPDGDSVAGTRIFEWDARNRLIAIVDGTRRSEFAYDGLDRRVEIVERISGVIASRKKFLWLGKDIGEERDSLGSTVTKKFFPQGFLTDTMGYFYTRDHLGSIREVVDSSGGIVARYEYDPFGTVTKVSGNGVSEFGFTGHYLHSPSGLHLSMYRAYNSSLGRWISRDPIGESGGLNIYGYAYNNPTNWVDLLGLDVGCSGGEPGSNKPPGYGPTRPSKNGPQPKGVPGDDHRWSPDPSDSRGGKWTRPGRPGAGSNWDDRTGKPGKSHWDSDDGKGNRNRTDENGNHVTSKDGHGYDGPDDPNDKPRPTEPDDAPGLPPIPSAPPTTMPFPLLITPGPCILDPMSCFPKPGDT